MLAPVYGCLSAMVSASKMIIFGGYHNQNGDSNLVYTVDFSNGNITSLTPLEKPIWSTMPVFFFNQALHYFYIGEDVDCKPDHFQYEINIPM